MNPGESAQRRRPSKLIVATVAVLVASACGSSSGSPAPPSTTVESSRPQPVPIATPAPPISVGAESLFVADGVTKRVAVLGFDPDAGELTAGPVSGGHWVAADVRTCIDQAVLPVTVSRSEWSLLDGRNGLYPSASPASEQFPQPEYPLVTDSVVAGECVRGWVLFAVGDGVTVDRVQYTANQASNVTWSTVGAVDIPAPAAAVSISEVSDPAVAVGQSCTRSSAVGVDANSGVTIVCVNLGPGRGPTWVNSVPIVGYNGAGARCDPLVDGVSQTSTGLAVLCVNAAWTYSP